MDDLDMEQRVIRVNKQLMLINHKHVVLAPKTHNGVRYIPMTAIVRSHVEEYLANCIKRYNLAYPNDPIEKFEPHICRHTFATNMQGLPDEVNNLAKALQG